jgi:hypothetical protein
VNDHIEQLGNADYSTTAYGINDDNEIYAEPMEYGVYMPYYMGDMSGYYYNDNNVYDTQQPFYYTDYSMSDEMLQDLQVYYVYVDAHIFTHLYTLVYLYCFVTLALMLRCTKDILSATLSVLHMLTACTNIFCVDCYPICYSIFFTSG